MRQVFIMQDTKYKLRKQIVYNTLYVMHCNEFINIVINQCLHKYCHNKYVICIIISLIILTWCLVLMRIRIYVLYYPSKNIVICIQWNCNYEHIKGTGEYKWIRRGKNLSKQKNTKAAK